MMAPQGDLRTLPENQEKQLVCFVLLLSPNSKSVSFTEIAMGAKGGTH